MLKFVALAGALVSVVEGFSPQSLGLRSQPVAPQALAPQLARCGLRLSPQLLSPSVPWTRRGTRLQASSGYKILREALQGLPVTGGYANLKDLFLKFDWDQTGIDAPKLKSALRDLGANIDDSQVEAVMRDLDISKDGIVDWPEFCNALEIVEVQMHLEFEKMLLEDQKAEEVLKLKDKRMIESKGMKVLREALGGLPASGDFTTLVDRFQEFNDGSGRMDGPRLKAALLGLGAVVSDEDIALVFEDLASPEGMSWRDFENILLLVEFQIQES